jgi:demethylmenaquinone methyltransferase/2-methoxy-6-polyprenyl-1,4-benzoquinol methylase
MKPMEEDYYSYTMRFFRLLAPFYDPVTFFTFRIRGMVVDFTAAARDERVLDVATGTGQQAFVFGKRGYDVVGVDLSADMLRIAREKNKYQTVSLALADAVALPFGDCCFDVSTVSFGLHEMPQRVREKVLQEMMRVTKSEGRIVIVDYALPQNSLTRRFFYSLIRSYEGKYYSRFINSSLDAMLRKHGISIEKEVSIVFGNVRLLKCKIGKDFLKRSSFKQKAH